MHLSFLLKHDIKVLSFHYWGTYFTCLPNLLNNFCQPCCLNPLSRIAWIHFQEFSFYFISPSCSTTMQSFNCLSISFLNFFIIHTPMNFSKWTESASFIFPTWLPHPATSYHFYLVSDLLVEFYFKFLQLLIKRPLRLLLMFSFMFTICESTRSCLSFLHCSFFANLSVSVYYSFLLIPSLPDLIRIIWAWLFLSLFLKSSHSSKMVAATWIVSLISA